MQKKSFLIKDILQKLNEDDSLKRSQHQTILVNGKEDKILKKTPAIDSNQLLYDWHSLAMAAMTQNNALINPKNIFTSWNKHLNILNSTIQDEFNYLNEQKKLKNYFQFNQSNSTTLNYPKTKHQLDYLIDEIEISENSSSSSLFESSTKCSEDCDDARSETSSLISIEDNTNLTTIKNNQNKSAQELRKEEKKKRKNRRNRTVFTEIQLMGLEHRFDKQKYLSTPDRAELANALGLSQLQVKTWYQNRRMKWKKHVMQGGCLVAPTKPKGRPKKGTIPSLGLTFDTNSLLSAVEARKNANLLSKEMNSSKLNAATINYDILNRKAINQTNLQLINNMNSIITKDLACTTNQLITLNSTQL